MYEHGGHHWLKLQHALCMPELLCVSCATTMLAARLVHELEFTRVQLIIV